MSGKWHFIDFLLFKIIESAKKIVTDVLIVMTNFLILKMKAKVDVEIKKISNMLQVSCHQKMLPSNINVKIWTQWKHKTALACHTSGTNCPIQKPFFTGRLPSHTLDHSRISTKTARHLLGKDSRFPI